MTNRIMLFGDSHSYAMQRAAERRDKKRLEVPIAIHRLLKQKNDVIIGDTTLEQFVEKIRKLTPDDSVISMIGGNQHAVFSTIQHPRPFDFLEPSRPDWVPATGSEIIPYAVLRANFAEGIAGGDGKSIMALRDATAAHVVHVLPPPPKRDTAHILKHHESKFAEDNIAKLGVSSAELRMKCWILQKDVLVKFCRKIDVEVMFPPEEACDADGFLLPEYYANDATHANPSYGELIMQKLESRWLTRAAIGD
ncbi:hypothetical protein [Novosphingobium ginsenosidimutans]|uniref:SGNH/GDSL hydrolase family protein n=1 Tax=Novosphingobium ginsenosidimutans TaxID=1176536 RepID=A0A5B8S417_9SPHN|nr:hypothetical protein [Novosphingobium ginsenosidimutans]QEA15812.1 hypothetical protein FRF71_06470 [Novosphingobium ginsenosidimutans]